MCLPSVAHYSVYLSQTKQLARSYVKPWEGSQVLTLKVSKKGNRLLGLDIFSLVQLKVKSKPEFLGKLLMATILEWPNRMLCPGRTGFFF